MSTPRVKGLAFKSVLATYEGLRGPSAAERALAQLPPDLAEDLRFRVVATGWYPIVSYRTLLEVVATTSGEGEAVIRQVGQEALRRDLRLVHRMALGLLSPATVMSISARLFHGYYDTGALEVQRASSGEGQLITASWSGCAQFSRLMWIEIVGSAEELLRASGAKDVRVVVRSGGRDDDPNMVLSISHR